MKKKAKKDEYTWIRGMVGTERSVINDMTEEQREQTWRYSERIRWFDEGQ